MAEDKGPSVPSTMSVWVEALKAESEKKPMSRWAEKTAMRAEWLTLPAEGDIMILRTDPPPSKGARMSSPTYAIFDEIDGFVAGLDPAVAPAPSDAELLSELFTKWKTGMTFDELTSEAVRSALAVREHEDDPTSGIKVVTDPVPGRVPVDPGPMTRPNGEVYHPRKVTYSTLPNTPIWDVRLIAQAREAKKPVLLFGVPGTGKTALAEAALPNLQTLQGSGETEVADFIGGYSPGARPGEYIWSNGPYTDCALYGWPLLVDEAPLIDPKVMAVLYAGMDGRGELKITQNPDIGTIKIHPDFYVIAAGNPDVPGAVMSDALLSRFPIQIEVFTDYDLALKLGCSREIITVAKNLKRRVESGDIMKAPQMRELLAFRDAEKLWGLNFALANLVTCAEPNDRKVVADALTSTFGFKVEALTI